MKKPIKINSNRAPINEEEIKQQKNFQNIWQKQYQRPKPLYKNPKFFGALIIIICLIAVIAIETFEKKEEIQPLKIITQPNTAVKLEERTDTTLKKNELDSVVPEQKEAR